MNNNKLNDEKPDFHDLVLSHNSITLINGKLQSFDFKSENFEDKNYFSITNLGLDHHLNFANSLKDNPMQNLNTALHEGGFNLNIKSDYKFKHPVVIYNYFTGI